MEYIQYTSCKYERYANFLVERHMEAPDNLLHKEDHSNIRDKIDGGGGQVDGFLVQAFPLNSNIPYSIVRGAYEVQRYQAGNIVCDVHNHDGTAIPEKQGPGLSRDKNA